MQSVKVNDTIHRDKIHYDDNTLIELYYTARNNFRQRRVSLESKRLDKTMTDYLSVAVARLAYEIVKEEHDLLLDEMNKRGISITIS